MKLSRSDTQTAAVSLRQTPAELHSGPAHPEREPGRDEVDAVELQQRQHRRRLAAAVGAARSLHRSRRLRTHRRYPMEG